jgi:energy-coupling factor transporter transmembrane protein EcfT
MPQPMGFHVRLGWSGWLVLLLVLGIVFTIAAIVGIVLLGALIVLLPIALVSAFVFYLFPSLRPRRPGQRARDDIIDGEYRVVDPGRPERDVLPDDRQ